MRTETRPVIQQSAHIRQTYSDADHSIRDIGNLAMLRRSIAQNPFLTSLAP